MLKIRIKKWQLKNPQTPEKKCVWERRFLCCLRKKEAIEYGKAQEKRKIISNKIEIIKEREITTRFVMIFSGIVSTGGKKVSRK